MALISTFLLLRASFCRISATALNHLIQFLHYVFSLLSSSSPTIATILAVFPTSLYTMKKKLNLYKDQFEKYVICPKCCSLYTYDKCLQTSVRGKIISKICNHIAFPHHPMASFRTPCGHSILKEVITKTDKKYYPYVTIHFQRVYQVF